MQEERDFIDETSAKMDPRIGFSRDATKPEPGEDVRPNKWANGGRDGTAERSVGLFRRDRPTSPPTAAAVRATASTSVQAVQDERPRIPPANYRGGLFDDQTCLNRYLMESAGARDTKVKVDMDGSLMLSVGGTPLTEFRSTRDGEVYWEKTQKAPCVWHFNNPDSKKLMPIIAKKFPSHWV